MTDLLASLVDRALDRAPVLQRRQPTIFEPAAEAAVSERSQFGNVSSLAEDETSVEPKLPPRAQKSASTTNPSQFSSQSPPPEEPRRESAESVSMRRRDNPKVDPLPEDDRERKRLESARPALISESTANAIGHEARRPSDRLVPHAIARREDIEVAPQRLIETIVERRIEREIISEHSKDSPAMKDEPADARLLNGHPESSGDIGGKQARQPLRVETKPRGNSKEEKTTKPLIPTKPAPRTESAPTVRTVSRVASTRSLKEPTAPTIHVTIGRIEVRATPLTTGRAPTTRPAGPRLSLEDYLRTRGEGNQ